MDSLQNNWPIFLNKRKMLNHKNKKDSGVVLDGGGERKIQDIYIRHMILDCILNPGMIFWVNW